jgi:mannan endo-1,4-beta-mannosidase
MATQHRLVPAVLAVFGFAVVGACTVGDAEPGDDDRDDDSEFSVSTGRARLLANLMAQMQSPSIMFGQQRFNLTGVNPDGTQWKASEGQVDRSDAKTLTGNHPVVLGMDVWDLALKPEDWDPTPAAHADAIKHVYESGGVATLDWHIRGCVKPSFYAESNEACLCHLANDDEFMRWWLLEGDLARLVDAFDRYGLRQIPMVFRPLHEHNGGWFWWGEPYWQCGRYRSNYRYTGAAAFQRVFRTIVTYLRVERGLKNLLIAYSPNHHPGLVTQGGYLNGYPGDAFVDIMGADMYYESWLPYWLQTIGMRLELENITRVARDHGKVAALTEVGDRMLDSEIVSNAWFSQHLLTLVSGSSIDLAYAMTWENRKKGPQEFWVPFGNHPSVEDFRIFEASDATTFLNDVPALYAAPTEGVAVCRRCSSDPDGDGWGWERETSCRVGSWCLKPEVPICSRCDADPDGDGWGWEDERSCEVLPTWR